MTGRPQYGEIGGSPVDKITFVVSRPGETPLNCRTIDVLRAAASYFEALSAIADASGLTFEMKGLSIEKGSIGVAAKVTKNPESAGDAVQLTANAVANDNEIPFGCKGLVDTLRENLTTLRSTGRKTSATFGDLNLPFRVESQPRELSRTILNIRARLISAGGQVPCVVFRADEGQTFRLKVSEDLAKNFGKSLYHRFDLTLDAEVQDGGRIANAELLQERLVSSTFGADEWIKWLGASIASGKLRRIGKGRTRAKGAKAKASKTDRT